MVEDVRQRVLMKGKVQSVIERCSTESYRMNIPTSVNCVEELLGAWFSVGGSPMLTTVFICDWAPQLLRTNG